MRRKRVNPARSKSPQAPADAPSAHRTSSKVKLIVLIGPTASGKSELAVRLAKKIKGEIISADSRQIYHGLDIGTGKVSGGWHKPATIFSLRSLKNCSKFIYKNIPHYCIDFAPPDKTITVAEYKKCAEDSIKDITRRGKTPILSGGTGFWIDAVVYDLNLPAVPPNLKLRKKLEKTNTGELLRILQKLDPKRAKTIEQKNPRRLIRAIEIARALGKVPKIGKKESPYDVLWIGLNPPIKILTGRIKKRTTQMLRRGLMKETKKLLKKGVSKKRLQEFGFEYRSVLNFIDKKISRRELLDQLVRDTAGYVRRQMTWWKKNQKIQWVKNEKTAEKITAKFLKTENTRQK